MRVSNMPRFVILFHQTGTNLGRPSHWDFLLENGPTLMAWALSAEPAACQPVEALALPEHRRHYLDYEGPLSADRGTVRRWDLGTFVWLQRSAQLVRIQLHGAKLSGEATLVLRATTEQADTGVDHCASQRWEFTFSAV